MTFRTAFDAAYSWWVHPEAAVDPHSGDVWHVAITSEGLNQVHRFTADGAVSTITLGQPRELDDHNGGAVLFHPDDPTRPALVFTVLHNTEDFIRMWIVDRASPPSELAPEQAQPVAFEGNCTYVQVAYWDGVITMWTRSPGTSGWSYRQSDDWGLTWGPVKRLWLRAEDQTSGQVYCTSWQDGATVHFAMYGHPTSSNYHKIHYCRANLATGQIVNEAGAAVGDLNAVGGPAIPIDRGTSLVFDAPPGTTSRLYNVGMVNGRVAVTYCTWPEVQDAKDGGNYWVARPDPADPAAPWQAVALGHSGLVFGYAYNGGMAIDSVTGDVWLARNTDDTGFGGAWQIERRYGLSFAGIEVVDSIVANDPSGIGALARPYVVRDAPEGGLVIWQRVNDYSPSTYRDYDIDSVLYVPSPVVEVPLPPIREPVERNEVTWVACDLATGRVIEEIPEVDGKISRLLGAYTTTSLTIPIPRSGPLAVGTRTYEAATQPGRTKIVAIINDVPTWEGFVVARPAGSKATVELSCATIEGYFDRRFVNDHRFEQADEVSEILRGLAMDATDFQGLGQGVAMVYDLPPTGKLRDRTYQWKNHSTVYSLMQNLMNVIEGPEWTVEPRWVTEGGFDAIVSVLIARKRIGRDTDAVFEHARPSEADYTFVEDYSAGNGANVVTTYSNDQNTQTASEPQVDFAALAAGAPIFEDHFQPNSGIVKLSTLNDYAREQLRRIKDGTITLTAEARWDAYPRINLDWQLGDTVQFNVRGHRHPNGFLFRGRMIGWDLDVGSGILTPTLTDTMPIEEGDL